MSKYPYRECGCGNQIHVGMRNLCDDCLKESEQEKVTQERQPTGFYGHKLIGKTYVHHKGGIYQLMHVAIDKGTGKETAVYFSKNNYITYCRPLSEFIEKFRELNAIPPANHQPRE